MKNFFKRTVAFAAAATMGIGLAVGLGACNSDDTLVVYTEAGFAPFEYVDGGKIVGVDVDIMNLVGEKLGKTVVFENVNFDVIVDTVSKGQLCNVGAAGISVTDERKEKVDFSHEYYTAQLYVIYKSAEKEDYVEVASDEQSVVFWDGLADAKIAVQTGTTADLFLGDELNEDWGALYGSNAQSVNFTSLAMAVQDVKTGNSDVLIIDELPAKKLIESDDSLDCVPLYYRGDEGEDDVPAEDVYAICVTKGKTEILNAINEVLDELGAEGIERLVQKHLGL